jgi:hypothetical protein
LFGEREVEFSERRQSRGEGEERVERMMGLEPTTF